MKRGMISVIAMFLMVGALLPVSGMAASASEKKVMIAIGLEPMHLDPSPAAAGSDHIVVENWGEFLIQREPNGDLKPGLAASWKWSSDEAVGIKTKLEGQELETFYATRRSGKQPTSDYVGIISGGLPGVPDPTYNYDLYFSTEGAFSTYSNPVLDKLNEEARATIDDKKRAALIKKIVLGMKEDVPCIPLLDNVAIYAMQKNVNFIPTLKYNMELVLIKDITLK